MPFLYNVYYVNYTTSSALTVTSVTYHDDFQLVTISLMNLLLFRRFSYPTYLRTRLLNQLMNQYIKTLFFRATSGPDIPNQLESFP